MEQVFLSYSRKDLGFIEHLAADLEAAGFHAWYDLSGLEVGTRWGQEIQQAITQSRYFLVVLSPNSSESEWVEREFLYASNLKIKVIPLLYKPCILPLWAVNLHFMELNQENYETRLPALLKILGVEALEEKAIPPTAPEPPSSQVEKEEVPPPTSESSPSQAEKVEIHPPIHKEKATTEIPIQQPLPPTPKPEQVTVDRSVTGEGEAQNQAPEKKPPHVRRQALKLPTKKEVAATKTKRSMLVIRGVASLLVFGSAILIGIPLARIIKTAINAPAAKGTPTSVTATSTSAHTRTFTRTLTRTPTLTQTLPPTQTATPGIDSTWLRPQDGMVMVYIPEGQFIMGQTATEAKMWCQLFDRDLCQGEFYDTYHPVLLDAYWIDQTEITNAMYAACVESGVCQSPSSVKIHWSDAEIYYGEEEYADFPVLIEWDNADTYCQWVGARLPTDAEWEKAARGTDGRPFPWGDTAPSCELANYAGIYDLSCSYSWCGCVDFPTRVGSFPAGASPYGALDMAGNASEWVSDWYRLDPRGDYYISTPAYNPAGPTTGTLKTVRCGDWSSSPGGIISTCRNWTTGGSGYGTGFRCAVTALP